MIGTRHARRCLSGLCMLTLIVAGSACTPPVAPRASVDTRLKATTRKPEDSVTVANGRLDALVEVRSPSGIGQATIERLGEVWPKSMTLRLHLHGMEHCEIVNGQTALNLAIGAPDGKIEIRQWQDKDEVPGLNTDSPLWTTVQILDRDNKPAARLPLEDGHFELQLPAPFLQGNPRSITLKWIDFYRR